VYVRTDVRVANGMSPNGDGQNDFWNIYNIQAYPNADIRLYNRWGALVYKVKGADLADFGNYWDGKTDGKDVPVGVYYYTIDLNNNQKPFIGSVTLVR
jgi:gliding motility-associated-like protein